MANIPPYKHVFQRKKSSYSNIVNVKPPIVKKTNLNHWAGNKTRPDEKLRKF